MNNKEQEIGLQIHKIRFHKHHFTVIRWIYRNSDIRKSIPILVRNTYLIIKSNGRRLKGLKTRAAKIYENFNETYIFIKRIGDQWIISKFPKKCLNFYVWGSTWLSEGIFVIPTYFYIVS